jgi:PEGA domain
MVIGSSSRKGRVRLGVVLSATMLISALLFPLLLQAQNQSSGNQIMGELAFAASKKPEKTAGVWVDGQYVGYVDELKGDKKILLLPGEHEISLRQTGYFELTQKIVAEPGKKTTITVTMQRNPNADFPKITGEIKLEVTPDRAAVFVDGHFAGTVNQFRGAGRGMLVAPGNHHIKIDLVGFQPFETDVTLLAKQKITVKTTLAPGTIQQSDPAVR